MTEQKPLNLRCKFCNSRFPLNRGEKKARCPHCEQDWNIRWFAEDTAMIISPVSWKQYAQRERSSEGIKKEQ
jgi:Zn finger protein HypA/HybF involved in hydrogenase expression